MRVGSDLRTRTSIMTISYCCSSLSCRIIGKLVVANVTRNVEDFLHFLKYCISAISRFIVVMIIIRSRSDAYASTVLVTAATKAMIQ